MQQNFRLQWGYRLPIEDEFLHALVSPPLAAGKESRRGHGTDSHQDCTTTSFRCAVPRVMLEVIENLFDPRVQAILAVGSTAVTVPGLGPDFAETRLRGEHQTPPARRTCQRRSWGRLPAAPSLCQRPQDNAKHDRINPLAECQS
jgi:hypothetical protein